MKELDALIQKIGQEKWCMIIESYSLSGARQELEGLIQAANNPDEATDDYIHRRMWEIDSRMAEINLNF